MIVVKTLEEAKQATAGFITTYFPFRKKKILYEELYQNYTGELYQGYTSDLYQEYTGIINSDFIIRGKKFGNQVMVGFWYFDPWYFDGNVDKLGMVWDNTSCVSWAEKQKIDVIWVPEFEDEFEIINSPVSKYHKKEIDRIWKEECYEDLFINVVNKNRVQKLKNICLSVIVCNTSWKYMIPDIDGIEGLIQAHFINTYTNSRASFLTLIKSPEGLNYSSSYFKYTDKEKAFLALIKPTIMRFDLSNDIGILKDQIDTFGKEINLKINRLEKFSNNKILGPGKKLVEIVFSVGKDDNIKYDHFAVLIN